MTKMGLIYTHITSYIAYCTINRVMLFILIFIVMLLQWQTNNIMHNLNHKDNNIAQKSSNIYITCLWFIVILGVIHDGPCNRRACECIQLLQEQTA